MKASFSAIYNTDYIFKSLVKMLEKRKGKTGKVLLD